MQLGFLRRMRAFFIMIVAGSAGCVSSVLYRVEDKRVRCNQHTRKEYVLQLPDGCSY